MTKEEQEWVEWMREQCIDYLLNCTSYSYEELCAMSNEELDDFVGKCNVIEF